MKLTGFGELFKRTWEIYTGKISVLAILFILPFAASLAVSLFGRGHGSQSTSLSGSPFSTSLSSNSMHYSGAAGLAIFLTVMIFVVVSLWIQIATIYVIDSPDDKPNATAALAKSWPLVWSLFIVAFLTGLAIIGGLILLIVPGIIFAVWFMFSSLELVLENKRGREALKASKALVTGRWGAVFGRYLLFFLCILGIYIVIGIVAALFRGLGFVVSGLFSSFLVTPLGAIFVYVLYKDLKGNATAPTVAPAVPATPISTPPAPTPPTAA